MLRNCSALALALAIAGTAAADPPKIDDISPIGVPRGAATAVTIKGGNLAGNPRLVAPFPLQVEPAEGSDGGNWKVTITVPAEVGIGAYPVRVATDDGVSNPFLLAVGQVAQVGEAEPNNTFDAAQAVPAPVVVEGQAAGNDVDYFRFPGTKGQTIVVDAHCGRIGSGVDPQIRLTTAGRTFVASADDTAGLLTDARLTAVLPEDGDYVVEISDSKYQGGGRAVYRLLIGAVPVAEEVYPLGGRRGETVGFELRGGTLGGTTLAAATIAAPAGIDEFRLRAPAPGGGPLQVETPGPLAVSELPEVREPADPAAPPVKAAAPVIFNGRLDPAGDEDRFTLPIAPGQKYRIEVEASELGSALDGVLQILDDKGKPLATDDDSKMPPIAGRRRKNNNQQQINSPDPGLEFAVPEGPTEITLALKDLLGRGGVGFPYRIRVEPVVPMVDVQLSGDPQANVPRGGTVAVPVAVARQGFNGPLTLEVVDPPAGLAVRGGAVAEGQGVGALTLTASPDAGFDLSTLKIVAKGEGLPAVEAVKLVVFAQQGNLPTNLALQPGLPTAPTSAGPASLDAPAGPIEVAHGTGGSIPLKVARTDAGKGELTVTALPMAGGLAVPELKIGADATEGTATVNVAPEAPLGASTVALSAKGKLGDKDVVLAVPAVTVQVVRPAAVELASPSVEVKKGQSAEIKGKVVRRGGFKEPVTVKLDGLPGGTKAEPVTVAPDASEFTLTLVAEDGANPAQADAKVQLGIKFGDKDYNTPPTALAVKVVE